MAHHVVSHLAGLLDEMKGARDCEERAADQAVRPLLAQAHTTTNTPYPITIPSTAVHPAAPARSPASPTRGTPPRQARPLSRTRAQLLVPPPYQEPPTRPLQASATALGKGTMATRSCPEALPTLAHDTGPPSRGRRQTRPHRPLRPTGTRVMAVRRVRRPPRTHAIRRRARAGS